MNMVKLWLLLRLSITGSILIGTLGEVVYRCSNEAKTWKEAVNACGASSFSGEILHVSVTNNTTLTQNDFEELTKTLNVGEGEEVWFGNYVTIGTEYAPPSNNLTPISTNDHMCGAVTWIPDGNGGLKTSAPLYQDCNTKLPFLCGFPENLCIHDEIKTWNHAHQACGTYPLYTPRDVHIPMTTSARTSVLYWVNKVWPIEWKTHFRSFEDHLAGPVLCGSVVYNSTTPHLTNCDDKKGCVCSFQNAGVDARLPSTFSDSCHVRGITASPRIPPTKELQVTPSSVQPPQQYTSNRLTQSLTNSTFAVTISTTMSSNDNEHSATAAETSHLAAFVGAGVGGFFIISMGLGIFLFIRKRRGASKKDKRSSNQYVDSNLAAGTGKTSGVQHINATYESDAFPRLSRTYDSSSPENDYQYAVVDHQVKVKELDQTSHYHSIEMNAEQELQPSIGGPTEVSGTCNTYDHIGDAGSSHVTTEAARDSENVYNRLGGENQYGAARKYGEAMTYDHVTLADASMYDTTNVNPDTKPDSTYDKTVY